jgi:FkbM family methyltransferase
MVFYDYIEIGTSDFDTEIQKNHTKHGVSIEPIKYYLDRLPNKRNCIKLNMGVSNYTGECVVNYLSEKTIEQYKFPYWVRGCNSINSYHKSVRTICIEKNLDIELISTKDTVAVTTLYEIINKLSIDSFYFLKVDTEGHDTIILKKFFEDIQSNMILPHYIMFESNVLSTDTDINEIINIFASRGYDLIDKSNDTILRLNLNNLKDKKTFSEGYKNYYIMDYPLGYSLANLPHVNSLDAAKEYCIQNNYSGVTLQNGIYQVRCGKYLNYAEENNLYSWVFL